MGVSAQGYRLSILLITSCLMCEVHAADFTSRRTAISIHHETIGDSVSYSPNLPEGGFADPQNKPRFQAVGIDLRFNSRRNTRFNVSAKQRQMNSLRDSFVVNEFNVGVIKKYKASYLSRFSLDLGIDFRVNQTSEIYKNSYTSYADQLITEVRLLEPEDARLSAQANLGIELASRTKLHIGMSGGISQTSQKSVTGLAQADNNCQYNFAASRSNGSVSQVGRCGSTLLFSQFYPSDELVDSNLGFSVNNDLSYRDYFIGPNLTLEWSKGNLKLSAGYEFRQYYRPELDDRIRSSGGSPVTRNQNAFANVQMGFWKNWQLNARTTYQSAAFLDDVPFLYTALTYQRFIDNNVLRYSFKLTRFF